MDTRLQTKLLHVIQNKSVKPLGAVKPRNVDFRLICAMNADLDLGMDKKRFRSDLFYRIGTLPLAIPPLRDRPADLTELIRFFIEAFAVELNIPAPLLNDEAVFLLSKYPWPGNVRELENVLKRAMISNSNRKTVLGSRDFDFPPEKPQSCHDDDAGAADWFCEGLETRRFDIKDIERLILERLLERHHGKVMRAARASGIPKDRFYRLTLVDAARRSSQIASRIEKED